MFVDWWSTASADWASLYATRDESIGLKAYALLSHVVFIAVVVRAVRHRNWFAAVLIALCTVVSLVYHVCLATDACLGATVAGTRASDRFTATVQLITFASFFIATSRSYAHAVVPLQLIIVGLAQAARPYSSYPVAVAIVVVALGFITRALVATEVDKEGLGRRRRLFWPAILGSIVCGCIAVVFFIVDTDSSVLHSSWHLFIGGTLLLGLEGTHGDDTPS